MKIYYQWEPGSYSHLAAIKIQKHLSVEISKIIGLQDFDSVWEEISHGSIWILPLENSYAGTIHQNVYNFLSYPHQIIGEYDFEVQHCLLSLESDISKIHEVYSHHQALSQTHSYIHKHKWLIKPYGDTAGSAKMISEKQKFWAAAIASKLAGEIYGLNVLEENIQDQSGNTTKFIVVVSPEMQKKISFSSQQGRVSIFFETRHTPWSLYESLWVFARRNINLTKIESIPLKQQRFKYGFWIRFEGKLWDENIQQALKELEAFTHDIRILGEY